jgi:NADH-quinone oxidoreductase subunit C
MSKTIDHDALAPLKSAFPDVRLLAGEFRGQVTVVVPREALRRVCLFLRDDPRTRYSFLSELNGVDYLNYPGAAHRFGVNYGLVSHASNTRLWLKVFLDPTQDTAPGLAPRDEEIPAKADPGLLIDSVTGVWAGAEWMEREVYDMFGIVFVDHPDLRRLLTWNNYGSYPLRKDYPLRGVGERENYKIITREGA